MTAAVETPVLVVDDSAAIRTYLAKNLEDLGIPVVTAANADDAMSVVMAGVTAVISDYNMAGKSGLDLVRDLRAVDERLPFFLMSGLSTDHFADDAYRAGATKVVDKLELAERLSELFGGYVRPRLAPRNDS
jgi:two-component system response regulator AtoC